MKEIIKYLVIFALYMLGWNAIHAQIPYYGSSQGKGNTYTYFSTKVHPGHNDQQMYITVQHGLTNHLDIVTDATIGTGWAYQGFGLRFNGISSKYFNLGGQAMIDFDMNDNYKANYECLSLYLNGNIYNGLHWVSNTWYTIYNESKNQVDEWLYLGWTVGKFTPMAGAIINCTDDFKSDLAVGCYWNAYKNGYIYLWGSGLTDNVYNPRIVVGFDYKF